MEIFLIDGIGPFFRGLRKKRVNWSKIPFTHLDGLEEVGWEGIGEELRRFAAGVKAQGYTAVSLDDVAHLAHHEWHEECVRERIEGFRKRFEPWIGMLREVLYVGGYARKRLFFRRVRIPPLFHVYWDTVFVNPGTRSLLRWLVDDAQEDLRAGEEVFGLFPGMMDDARAAGLPVEDIGHMSDLMGIILLVRRYCLGPRDAGLEERIAEAKRAYKERWPKVRRYRIRIMVGGGLYPPGAIGAVAGVFFRRRAAYRMWDRLFVLPVPGALYRSLLRCRPEALPKFLRKSAMGVGVVLR